MDHRAGVEAARSSSICSAKTRNRRETFRLDSKELAGTTTTYCNCSPSVDAIALRESTRVSLEVSWAEEHPSERVAAGGRLHSLFSGVADLLFRTE